SHRRSADAAGAVPRRSYRQHVVAQPRPRFHDRACRNSHGARAAAWPHRNARGRNGHWARLCVHFEKRAEWADAIRLARGSEVTGLLITAILFPIAGCVMGRRPLAECFLLGIGVVGSVMFVSGVFHLPFVISWVVVEVVLLFRFVVLSCLFGL